MSKKLTTGTGKFGRVETDAMAFKRLDAIYRKSMPENRKVREALLAIQKLSPERYEANVLKLKERLRTGLAEHSKGGVTEAETEIIFNAMYFPEKLDT